MAEPDKRAHQLFRTYVPAEGAAPQERALFRQGIDLYAANIVRLVAAGSPDHPGVAALPAVAIVIGSDFVSTHFTTSPALFQPTFIRDTAALEGSFADVVAKAGITQKGPTSEGEYLVVPGDSDRWSQIIGAEAESFRPGEEHDLWSEMTYRAVGKDTRLMVVHLGMLLP